MQLGLQTAPLPSPPQTSPLSLPQPPCLRWPMCPSWGRVLISVTRMFTVRICLLTASPMLCSFRWICVFSGRTSCDFSGRASPILQHHQKQTSEDFSVCHLWVRAGSLGPALLCPFWGQLPWANAPQHSCDSGQFVISILIKSLPLGIDDGEPYVLFLNLSSMFYLIYLFFL